MFHLLSLLKRYLPFSRCACDLLRNGDYTVNVLYNLDGEIMGLRVVPREETERKVLNFGLANRVELYLMDASLVR